MKKHYSVSQLIERVKKGYYTRKGNEPVFGSGRGRRQKEYGDEVRKLANRLASQVKKTGGYDAESFELLLEAMETQETGKRIKESDITQTKSRKRKYSYNLTKNDIIMGFIERLENFSYENYSNASKHFLRTGELTDYDYKNLMAITQKIETIKSKLYELLSQQDENITFTSSVISSINYNIDRIMYSYSDDAMEAYNDLLDELSGYPMSIEESEAYEDWEYYEE